jgi:hypothetical protein
MGGGTSGLFYGTRGSRQVYQFSLFPDTVRKDSPDGYIAKTSFNGESTTPRSKPTKQIITVEMVLEKIEMYYSNEISCTQLAQWLTAISTSPYYQLRPSRLKAMVLSSLKDISKVKLSSGQYNQVVFDALILNLKLDLQRIL